MKKLYEVEIERRNISPKQFFTYCKKQIIKRTGEDNMNIWCDSYEAWAGKDGIPEYSNMYKHEDGSVEICHTKAFDWQIALTGQYNFIMEFQFDDDNKGFGYMFMMEVER